MIYRKTRRKYIRREWRIIATAMFAVGIIIVWLFFALRTVSYQSEQKTLPQKPVPLPTAIDPNFLTQVDDCFIPAAAVYGYTLRITAGFRSLAEQNQLYQQGRTTDGHIITEASAYRSIHNYGVAVDVVDRWRGYDINWTKLIKIGAYCGLESGGDGDRPHFEHRGGLTTAQFETGMRPPALALPCPIMAKRKNDGARLTLKDLQKCKAPRF